MNKKRTRSQIEQDNKKVIEIIIILLILIVITFFLPSFILMILFMIILGLINIKYVRIISIVSLIAFIFLSIKNVNQLFSYYGYLKNKGYVDLEIINTIFKSLFKEIPSTNLTGLTIYILLSLVLVLIPLEYKNRRSKARINSLEENRDKFYQSKQYEKVKKQRLKLNSKLQKKWRKQDKPKNILLGHDEKGVKTNIDFKELNQHMFVSATTGGGKTVLLMSFVEYAVKHDFPIVFIDGKGSLSTIEEFKRINKANNREINVFGDQFNLTYNPIKYGNSQVISDKLKQLVSTESVYYSNINDLLVQNIIMFLDDYKIERNISNLVYYLDPENVKEKIKSDKVEVIKEVERKVKKQINKEENSIEQQEKTKGIDIDEDVEQQEKKKTIDVEEDSQTEIVKEKSYVLSNRAERYKRKLFDDYKETKDGDKYLFINAEIVRVELQKIIDSEIGHLFKSSNNELDLIDISNQSKSLFVSFDGTIYDEFIKKIARFLILDINYLVSLRNRKEIDNKNMLCIYDEFGVYANNKIVDTINKSREAGLHCVIATQTIYDLDVEKGLLERVLANTNTLMVGQTNESDEVDRWSKTFGVYKDLEITRATTLQNSDRINRKEETEDRGSARHVQKFNIEPQQIRNLTTGQFILQRKAKGKNEVAKIVYTRNTLEDL